MEYLRINIQCTPRFFTKKGDYMGKPTSSFLFASKLGRHTAGSLGHDLNIPKIVKNIAKTNLDASSFSEASNLLNNVETIMRVINVGGKLVAGLTDNGNNSVANNENSLISLVSSNETNGLGKNESIYKKTIAHIGKKTSSKIKFLQKNVGVEHLTKSTADSLSDYQDHKKRQQLQLGSGFNEKGFAFLGEDHYYSISDYYKLFNIEKKYKKQFEENKDGQKDIFGCVLKTVNQIKIRNRISNYSIHIKIHLIKILDLDSTVRSLITDLTHNSSSKKYNPAGKIPKDYQYSDPVVADLKNRFSTNFTTSLSCALNLSTLFNEKAKIINTWTTTLPPASIWEFNLTTHLGRGIHLNRINDLYNEGQKTRTYNQSKKDFDTAIDETIIKLKKTATDPSEFNLDKVLGLVGEEFKKKVTPIKTRNQNDHPSGYILCLEYVGDRRGSIRRNEDSDIFEGYSPCKIGVEFKHELSFLAHEDEKDSLVIYKRSRQEKNFSEGSEFPDIFCPDRAGKFHVKLEDINFSGENKKAEYNLEYDTLVLGSSDTTGIFEHIQKSFKDLGLDPKDATEDDKDLKMETGPTELNDESEYQGPDSPPTGQNLRTEN
jgi:hypothetical protein